MTHASWFRRCVTLLTSGALLALTAVATTPAVDAGAGRLTCLRIVDGVFDAAGTDASNLGGEWLRIRNVCPGARDLGGWTVSDLGGAHTYTFPAGLGLAGRSALVLRSGDGPDSAHERYWGSAAGEIWDASRDERAFLRDARPAPVADWSAVTDRALIGAGDVASCGSTRDSATASLLRGFKGTVLTFGDNAYSSGSAAEFANCYAPTWGQLLATTRPSAGNHDHLTANAAGYFGYFGAHAGPAGRGYYSYERGAWHIVVLDSECDLVGGCAAGSPQERWLRADLEAHPADCTLAYWHKPLYSSGAHGNDPVTRDLWRALLDYDAELVLNGHDHDYERFAPQDAGGHLDKAHGMREFVVGTGGAEQRGFFKIRANSELRHRGSDGVLRIDLRPQGYSWRFLATAGDAFADSGRATCH